MKINEFRIGNYCQDSKSKEPLRVSNLSEKGISFWVIDRSKMPLPDGWQAEPIPLDDDWLSTFGFEQGLGAEWELEVGDDILEINKYNEGYMFTYHMGSRIGKPLCFVHELQNLYFSIYRTELAFKHTASPRFIAFLKSLSQ